MERVRQPHVGPGWILPGLLASGLGLSGLMIARSQVDGDALSLLGRGWLLAAKGIWVPFGNPISSGGFVPGNATSLLVGLPLSVWMDHRAPLLLLLGLHLAGYLLIDAVVRDALGTQGRIALAVFYWLNPWRLHQSACLMNPNYLFLAGAVHLWACYGQRDRPRFGPSLLLVVSAGLGGQLHASVGALVLAALGLGLRGYWKPHWGGVAMGTAVVVASLIPWFLEVLQVPELIAGAEDGMLQRNLPYLYRAVGYWLRYPSLWCAYQMTRFDFTPAFGAWADAVLSPLYSGLARIVGPLTISLPLVAGLWSWRALRFGRGVSSSGRRSPRAWLRGYALWVFGSYLISVALSPTLVMRYHGFVVFPAAVLPAVLWTALLLRSRHRLHAQRVVAVWLMGALLLATGMAVGSRAYRLGGREAMGYVAASDHEMLWDLALTECCLVSVDPERGRWPHQRSYYHRTYFGRFVLPSEVPVPEPR